MIGKFVTAKLKGNAAECRQGWVICQEPILIQGQSGDVYECEGELKELIDPPGPFRSRCKCAGWPLESDYCKYCGGYKGP